MAEFTFPCPSCHKNIQCDDSYCGQSIACPMCNAQFNVPKNVPAGDNPLVPKPPGENKLKAGPTQVARSSFGANVPVRKTTTTHKGKSSLGTYAAVVLVLAALGFAGYMFGWPAYTKWKEEKAAEAEAAAEAERKAAEPAPDPAAEAAAQAAAAATNTPVAPTWTLDVAKATIPGGRVNGTITGTNFVAETTRLDRNPMNPTTWVLNLRQGTGISPDRGVLVVMKLGAGEMPTNRTFTVATNDKPANVTQVTKLWKTNPRYEAQRKNYTTGYAMKLEFGSQAETGEIPGKIFLSLPDPEKSVVGGAFNLTTTTPVQGEMMPVQQQPVQDTEAQRRMQQRYGIRR